MRERISMLLFRRMGFPASREVTARLFVNNEFAGVYTMVESVDKAFLKRVFSENDGFLFSYEWAGPYYFTDRGTDPRNYVPSPFQPETHEDDPKPEAIVDLVQAINRSADFAREIATYIDLKKFVRHIAVETCLADHDDFLGDAGMANFFLYRPPDKKQFGLIAWDKSEAFTHPQFDIFQHIRNVPPERGNQLVSRALGMPEHLTTYLDTLLECVQSLEQPGTSDPRGWLEREIDRENAQLRDATLSDPVKPFTNGEYDAAVAAMREFAQRRGPFVRQSVDAARYKAGRAGQAGRAGRKPPLRTVGCLCGLDSKALPKRIVVVHEERVLAGDPRRAFDLGHDRLPVADKRVGDDAAAEA